MRILVLDDDDIRHDQFRENLKGHEVVHAHTVQEAGDALGAEKFDVVYLDHDLNDFVGDTGGYGRMEQTGFDVARFIARYLAVQKRPDRVIVHSWNAAGAHRMVAELREAGIPALYEPFNGKSGTSQTQPAPEHDPNWVTVKTLEAEPLTAAQRRDAILKEWAALPDLPSSFLAMDGLDDEDES